MDTTNVQADSDAGLHQSNLSFPDFVSGTSNSYDVGAFTPQDMSLAATGTPAASEPEVEAEPIKSETPA
jgi:hypothetical protein